MDLAVLLTEEETARFENGDERVRAAIRATLKLLPLANTVLGKDEDGALYDLCFEWDGAVFVPSGD